MLLPRPARLLSALAALLEFTQHSGPGGSEIEQIRKSIIDHGRMVYNLYSVQWVRIEVKQLAYRLRESPADVIAALMILENDGLAFRTTSKGLWKLRVTSGNDDSNSKLSRDESRSARHDGVDRSEDRT